MMSRPDRNSTRHTTSTRVGHVIAESATYAQVLNDIDLPLCARHGQYVGAFDLVGGGSRCGSTTPRLTKSCVGPTRPPISGR